VFDLLFAAANRLMASIENLGSPPLDPVDLETVRRFAGMIHQDEAALRAAKQAAHDVGAYHIHPIPGVFWEMMARWEDIPPHRMERLRDEAQQRFDVAISEQAVMGARAYLLSKRGNAYTRFLLQRFGPSRPPLPKKVLTGPPSESSSAPASPRMATWIGSPNGDRFGAKQFVGVLDSPRISPRTALGHVSQALLNRVSSPVSSGQPWKVVPGVYPSNQAPGSDGFIAHGSYQRDHSPRVSVNGNQAEIHFDVSGGRGRGTGGIIQLECIAVENPRADQLRIVLEFGESRTPMWLNPESEVLVACTVRQLVSPLAHAFRTATAWEYRLGDWVNNQLVTIPGYGVFSLQARS
jgi:hypothetical protein